MHQAYWECRIKDPTSEDLVVLEGAQAHYRGGAVCGRLTKVEMTSWREHLRRSPGTTDIVVGGEFLGRQLQK